MGGRLQGLRIKQTPVGVGAYEAESPKNEASPVISSSAAPSSAEPPDKMHPVRHPIYCLLHHLEAWAFSSCYLSYSFLPSAGAPPAQELHPAAPGPAPGRVFQVILLRDSLQVLSRQTLAGGSCNPVLSRSWLLLQCLAPSFSSFVFL